MPVGAFNIRQDNLFPPLSVTWAVPVGGFVGVRSRPSKKHIKQVLNLRFITDLLILQDIVTINDILKLTVLLKS